MYPLLLDVTSRLIVVVGGGAVAVRKVKGLLEAGATHIRVVAPQFHDQMPPGVQRIESPYHSEHLRGAQLVFAVTDDPVVNDAVVRDASALGALVNRADGGDEVSLGDFSTPAILRDGPITITVSTAGSPALAAMIRDQLRHRMDPRWTLLAHAMKELRPWVKAQPHLTLDQRREIFRTLATAEALDTLASSGIDGLKRWLSGRFSTLA